MKSSCNVALTEKSFESLFKDVPVKKDPSVQKASGPILKRIVGKFLNVSLVDFFHAAAALDDKADWPNANNRSFVVLKAWK